MKCFVFSIGEKTTDLCVELMESYGFEVILYQDQTSLWEKLKRFYTEALETEEDEFVRIDADIIPNINIKQFVSMVGNEWGCAVGYDWYKQDNGSISIHLMTRDIIKTCLEHIEEAEYKIRPETYLWRLPDINPKTWTPITLNCGVHGYGQQDQRERIKKLKSSRDQQYDWDLLEKIEAL